jgi:hypothetical protein
MHVTNEIETARAKGGNREYLLVTVEVRLRVPDLYVECSWKVPGAGPLLLLALGLALQHHRRRVGALRRAERSRERTPKLWQGARADGGRGGEVEGRGGGGRGDESHGGVRCGREGGDKTKKRGLDGARLYYLHDHWICQHHFV